MEQFLATKLYIPPPRPKAVPRPRLIERLNSGLHHKLTLISAAAGFGKTTLVSEWLAGCEQLEPKVRLAWLALDEGDNDPSRFLAYLTAALQTVAPDTGAGVLAALQAPQPPAIEALLTVLVNEINALPGSIVLVLDDYHSLDSEPVDRALTFLLEHLPPQLHLVIATREDPHLPVALLRARGQLTELRAADLRFTPTEAAEFLNQVMGLQLSAEDIAALETRTEGWIAGLQLAALALQGLSLPGAVSTPGHPDASAFIKSFTGSHHFVLDYLIEEVLGQQPESVQTFLLRTSMLERMCGPLCEAVCGGANALAAPASGQATLEYLERANLFIVPLDNERRWYRYHHLFADLLRKRLGQSLAPAEMTELHIRASEWYEANDLLFEAFRHAAQTGEVERTERLIGSRGMNLHLHSVAMPVLDWLAALPKETLDARPKLWVRSATLALMSGVTSGVEEKLVAAEAAIAALAAAAGPESEPDDQTRDLIGQIACARATLALTRYDPQTMVSQARRALEYLAPNNLSFRFTANWALASAYIFLGERSAAARACQEGLTISQKSGEIFSIMLACANLGRVQELENELPLAAESYRKVLQLAGSHPQPNIGDLQLGLARILYEWNELEAAEQNGEQSLQLLRQFDSQIDRFILAELFLARLKLTQGDQAGAESWLAQAEQATRQPNFAHRAPEAAAVRVLMLLQQNKLEAAAQLAQAQPLPFSQARVHLAQGDPTAALAALEPARGQAEARGWVDERLKALVLEAVAYRAQGEKERAVQRLGEALALAEPGGFVRTFVDEGAAMAELLAEAAASGVRPDYCARLLAACEAEGRKSQEGERKPAAQTPAAQPLIEPLSPRELSILRLMAQGLSNREISQRLFLALSTIKGHNQKIFDKLQVQSRTEAIARARERGVL